MGPRALAIVLAAAAAAGASAADVAVTARQVQPGELVVLTIDQPSSGTVHVRAFDREIAGYAGPDRKWHALIGIDLDVKPGAYAVDITAGDVKTTHTLNVTRKIFRTRRLTVDPNFVTPPPEAAERIEREAKLLAATWKAAAPDRLWSAAFAVPVREPANSAFGTRSVFNGLPRGAHGGADFLSPAGTAIHAPNDGRVAIARDLYFSGNTVVIDHGLGVFSMLAHLSAFDVREGDAVTKGQIVGRVGATGRVTGPHLHWAVRINGARIDPLSLLATLGKTATADGVAEARAFVWQPWTEVRRSDPGMSANP